MTQPTPRSRLPIAAALFGAASAGLFAVGAAAGGFEGMELFCGSLICLGALVVCIVVRTIQVNRSRGRRVASPALPHARIVGDRSNER